MTACSTPSGWVRPASYVEMSLSSNSKLKFIGRIINSFAFCSNKLLICQSFGSQRESNLHNSSRRINHTWALGFWRLILLSIWDKVRLWTIQSLNWFSIQARSLLNLGLGVVVYGIGGLNDIVVSKKISDLLGRSIQECNTVLSLGIALSIEDWKLIFCVNAYCVVLNCILCKL